MANAHNTLPGEIDFLSMFQEASQAAVSDLAEADTLEARAARLRAHAPKRVDQAISTATARLIELHETGAITDRDAISAVSSINQHKPSRTIWSGPANTERDLEWFDAIGPYTPVVQKYAAGERVDAFVTSIEPARVHIVEARGHGGLPQAVVQLDAHQVIWGSDDKTSVDLSHDAQPLKATIPFGYHSMTVGRESIQGLLDSRPVLSSTSNHLRSESMTIKEIRSLASAASLLVAIGYDFDMDHIDRALQGVDRYERAYDAQTESARKRVSRVRRQQGVYLR